MLVKNEWRKWVIAFLWVLGFVVLFWGLSRLYNIFVDEKMSASYELAARVKTLEQYAAQAVQLHMQRELQKIEPSVSLLKNDPLINFRLK